MRFKLWSAGLMCALAGVVVSGCGGGGSSTSGTPEGVYEGNTSTNKYFNTLVLENGLYYTMYGTLVANTFTVQGLINGTGQAANGNFSSSDLKDFFSNGTSTSGALNATYKSGSSFNGAVTESTSSYTFTGAPPANTSYNYNVGANLANISGTWNMTSLSGVAVTLNVGANGTYTAAAADGCNFSGSITPRATGKNVFDVSTTFGPTVCALANQTITGNAVEYLLPNGQRQLIAAVINPTRDRATVILGAR